MGPGEIRPLEVGRRLYFLLERLMTIIIGAVLVGVICAAYYAGLISSSWAGGAIVVICLAVPYLMLGDRVDEVQARLDDRD
jgi:hypothetical protein